MKNKIFTVSKFFLKIHVLLDLDCDTKTVNIPKIEKKNFFHFSDFREL